MDSSVMQMWSKQRERMGLWWLTPGWIHPNRLHRFRVPPLRIRIGGACFVHLLSLQSVWAMSVHQ